MTPSMQQRTLGAGGPTVSMIGMGTAALGRPLYINDGHGEDLAGAADPDSLGARAGKVFDAALAGGITYFDTARSYGLGERFLGRWLNRRGRVGLTVGSKWGYTYVADWDPDATIHEVKDHSLSALRRQLGESRAELGNHLGVYQIHSVTPDSPVLDDAAVTGALNELRATGVRIGLTTSGPEQANVIRRALELAVDGTLLFATVQATWNLLERSAGPALDEAHDAGLGVIVKEALANGRLAGSDDRADAAHLGGWPPDAVALAAAASQPWADVVLSGAATVDQLRSNLQACQVMSDLDPDSVLAAVAPIESERYWSERSQRPWT
jgi:aryl-alcohol dehydrogenase-like predicted oxidoreductase